MIGFFKTVVYNPALRVAQGRKLPRELLALSHAGRTMPNPNHFACCRNRLFRHASIAPNSRSQLGLRRTLPIYSPAPQDFASRGELIVRRFDPPRDAKRFASKHFVSVTACQVPELFAKRPTNLAN
jgi:hypothetical protein